MAVDAPTTSNHSILLAIQFGLSRGWHISVGDIRTTFLDGVPAPRQLCFQAAGRWYPITTTWTTGGGCQRWLWSTQNYGG